MAAGSSGSNDFSINEAPRIILLSSNENTKDMKRELRRRGFMVENHVVKDVANPVYKYVVAISEKLYVKLLIENDFPLVSYKACLPLHKLLVMQAAEDMLKRYSDVFDVLSVWIAHDEKKYTKLFHSDESAGWVDRVKSLFKYQSKVNPIYEYFGPQIALYFAWIDHYTENLTIPAIAGALVFYHQYSTNSIDSQYMPYFAILIAIWGTTFMEFWKGKCSEHAYRWGVFGVEDDEADEELASAPGKENSSRMVRLMVSFTGTVSIIYLLLQCMLYYVDMQHHSEDIYGKDSWMKFYPSVIYSALPVVFPMLFEPIANYLNLFEAHATKAEEEQFMVMKRFVLQFINRYCALLYVAFWKRDLAMLRSLLISLLTTGALINNAVELGIPFLKNTFNRSKHAVYDFLRRRAPPVYKLLIKLKLVVGETEGVKPNASANVKGEKNTDMKLEEVEKLINYEEHLEEYNLDDDYLEMVLQFGYVTMFAVVFPLTPLLALVNNFFEARVDLAKLGQCRRPRAMLRSTIGAWQTCMEFISFVAVFTNCFLLAIVSNHLQVIVPSSLREHLNSEYARLLVMLILEHLLLALKVVLMHVIEDVPRTIQEKLARERLNAKKKATDLRFQNANLDNLAEVEENPEEEGDTRKEEQAPLQKLQGELVSPFSFNPLSLMSIVSAPVVLQSMNISPYLYLPISAMVLSYFQAAKDRVDRKAAIGIVSDPNVLKFVVSEMPNWFADSDFHRVEWLNSILQKLWPFVSHGVDQMVKEKVNPILAKAKPSLLTELELTSCSLGTISPKIVGIKVHNAADSTVRFDIEINWAGDPRFALKAGTVALPSLCVELSEIHFSATFRVELRDLNYTLPGFRALTFTCMNGGKKKLYVNFALKIAGMDIMGLGAGEFNIMSLVRTTIETALASTLIYPEKVVVVIDKSAQEAEFMDNKPQYLIVLTVEKANNLKAVNMLSMGTSDPYVVATVDNKSGHQVKQTKTMYGTVNPVWNETFQFDVIDINQEIIDFVLKDSDIGMDTVLGKTVFELKQFKGRESGATITKELPMKEGKGSLTVTCRLFSLNDKKGDKKGSMNVDAHQLEKDLLYDLKEEELDDNEKLKQFDHFAEENDERASLSIEVPRSGKHLGRPSSLNDVTSPATVSSNISPNRAEMMKRTMSMKPTRSPVGEKMSGMLIVSVIRAKNLKTPSSSWFDSNFRPFAIVTIGAQVQETKALKNTYNPQFTETLRFFLDNLRDETLHIKLMERNKLTSHSLLGEYFLPLFESGVHKKDVEEEYLLHGADVSNSFVGFKLSWVAGAPRTPK